MESTEARLKEKIINQYGSLKKFCELIDMPWTTLDSILKRGIANSNITNVLKITQQLKVDTESLVSGVITSSMPRPEASSIITVCFSGDEYTEAELDKIKEFAAFVKASRK